MNRSRARRLVYLVTHGVTAKVLLRGQLAYLRDRGFDVTVIASPGPELDAVREQGVRTVGVPMSRSVRLHEGPAALARVASALRRLRPDIVNASTAKAGLIGMVASRGLRIPARVYLVRGLRFEGLEGLRRRVFQQTERLAAACATHVVCGSESVRRVLIEQRLTAGRSISVIPSNGVDPERFRARGETRATAAEVRARFGIPRGAFVAGFVGRLVADKGVSDMLEALERTPSAWLLVVGGDLAGDALPDDLARRLKAHPRVAMAGSVDDPAPYYAAMDTLLFPSYREGMPNAPLEAAAAELPVVGYRVTGVVDAVADGSTGLLVPKHDTGALGEALSRYAGDAPLREAHGRAGRERILKHFTNETTWSRWADLYEQLLASSR